eukprot:2772421-Rhodomonas_salina.1
MGALSHTRILAASKRGKQSRIALDFAGEIRLKRLRPVWGFELRVSRVGLKDLGHGVENWRPGQSSFRVQSVGSRVQGPGSRVQGLGSGVWGL